MAILTIELHTNCHFPLLSSFRPLVLNPQRLAGSTESGSAPCFLALRELLLGQKCSKQDFAKGDVTLWIVDQIQFNLLVQEHPDIGLALYKDMSQQMDTAIQVYCCQQTPLCGFLLDHHSMTSSAPHGTNKHLLF